MMRVAVITGGSSGVGFNATKKLVQRGIFCIIASRNTSNVNIAVEQIKHETKLDNVEGMSLDLSDFDSVHRFVRDFEAKNIPLNILINNAGLHNRRKVMTQAGIEETFCTNHLGHFLLTSLLLEKLKKSAPSTVIVVSSALHDAARRRGGVEHPMEDYNFTTTAFDGLAAYSFSKLANLLFAYELHRRLEGSGVLVNAVSPGFIPTTRLSRGAPYLFQYLFSLLSFFPFARTIDHGGDTLVDLTSEEIREGGKYYHDRIPVDTSERSKNRDEQKKLWDLSEKLVHLS